MLPESPVVKGQSTIGLEVHCPFPVLSPSHFQALRIQFTGREIAAPNPFRSPAMEKGRHRQSVHPVQALSQKRPGDQ